ncbi:RNA pseudouridine synthase [Virgibacillus phasianinus]|uniref:Pseudouridine synthase n=2 Tax=Virgibacillus phasianinus TaxID=2017483 RepID=A0A220U8F8_9BACI|nr:RNA pseudouridine synthase [Virgibacillus phasianinus]
MSIYDYLRTVQDFSHRIVKRVKETKGLLKVNGRCQIVRYELTAGDVLEAAFPPETIGPGLVPEDIPLSIVYEDEAVLVIDKPAGVATIPSFNHRSGTIGNAVLGYYQKQQIPYTIHVVTRLDRDTSGLLLIAKHQYSHSLLAKEQQANQVDRTYCAVVEGAISQTKGTIDADIARKEGSIIERVVGEKGKRAVTHYQVEKRSSAYTMVKIKLDTGRTHQIRVHFSHIGHSLAGDDLYGGSTENIDHQALHCMELQFRHPFTKKRMHFNSAPPKKIAGLMEKS